MDLFNIKDQIRNGWDLGRLLLAFSMAGTGLFLISILVFHGIGMASTAPLPIRITAYLPFALAAYGLGSVMLKVFMRFRQKCSNEWDFWMIMLSFSLAGMFIMPVRILIFHLLGITNKTALWIKVLVYIPIIPPAYYCGLLVFGTLLGQSSFFKAMISARLKFLTGRKNIKH